MFGLGSIFQFGICLRFFCFGVGNHRVGNRGVGLVHSYISATLNGSYLDIILSTTPNALYTSSAVGISLHRPVWPQYFQPITE